MKTIKHRVESFDLYTAKENMEEDILQNLSQQQKQIPSKYFYDKRGSELFEQITQQEEYYPTQAETEIFLKASLSIARCTGPVHTLIEYGSGSSQKIKTLLSSFQSLKTYMPIDISKEFLLRSSEELSIQYPHLEVKAVCGDYTAPLELPLEGAGKKTIFFPGSTIGNFEPQEAKAFLVRSARLLNDGDGFIVGVDTKKDCKKLEAAYNDANGITAEFNVNVLRRINRELGANFDLDQFEHKAFYNGEKGRIEMHLRSKKEQKVQISNRLFEFKKNETIHTENSYKYSIEEFQLLVQQCGFIPVKVWTDENETFSVHYMEKQQTKN